MLEAAGCAEEGEGVQDWEGFGGYLTGDAEEGGTDVFGVLGHEEGFVLWRWGE